MNTKLRKVVFLLFGCSQNILYFLASDLTSTRTLEARTNSVARLDINQLLITKVRVLQPSTLTWSSQRWFSLDISLSTQPGLNSITRAPYTGQIFKRTSSPCERWLDTACPYPSPLRPIRSIERFTSFWKTPMS